MAKDIKLTGRLLKRRALRLATQARAGAAALRQQDVAAASAQAAAAARRHRAALRRAAVVLALAALAWGLWTALAGPKQVRVVAAKRGDAAEVVYATGVVEPVLWAKVTALQRKRITEICKCEGQAVKKGDVLARLDDVEEKAALSELQARLKRLEDDAERMTTLVQRNITSKTTLDEKLTQIQEQKARIAAQQDRIFDLTLRAPMDGVVLRRDGEVGEVAGTGTGDTLLWVGQPKPLRIVAEVNEDDIIKVKSGQKVLLRHEGHSGSPLTGTVDRITPKGDPSTKTFRVYLSLPDDTPLKIGMSVEANIVVNEVKDSVVVPTEALGDHSLIVVDEGRARHVPVEIGIRGTTTVEIRSGIAAGARIISPYDTKITDGTAVSVTGPHP